MAQVKKIQKMQNGGKTFKIAGHTFNTSNEADMKMLQELASDSNYGGIAQGILDNVNDAAYADTLNAYRTADGRVVMEGELQHIKDKHMSAGTQKATSRRDNAFWNTVKRRSGKEWANDMDAFLSEVSRRKSGSGSSSSTGDGKIKISGVSGLGGKWIYNDQGWDEANITNSAMLKELQLLEDYYNASEDNRKNKYDVSGLDKRSLEAYINMRQNNPNLYAQYKDKLIADADRLADNDDFYSTYGWFGFTPGTAEEIAAAAAKRDQAKLLETLKSKGLEGEGIENLLALDGDGNVIVTDDFLSRIGGNRSGHYWLNDNWANYVDENGNTNPYQYLKDHIIWNGRLYKQDDAEVINQLNKSGYVEANKNYDAETAERIMRTSWSDNPSFAHKAYDSNQYYSEWANGLEGLRYRTMGGYNIGDGNQLVEYYTDADPTDAYGFRTVRHAIVDKNGKLVKDNIRLGDYQKTGKYEAVDDTFMQKLLGEEAGKLAGTYVQGAKNPDGTASNTFYYRSPDGEMFIQDPDLKGNQRGKAVRIPKEIATMIPDDVWEYFRTDKNAQNRLFKMLRDFTNTGFNKVVRNFHPFGWVESTRESLLKSDFQKAGLSKDQARELVKLLNKYGTNRKFREVTGRDSSKATRQDAFLAEPVVSQDSFKFKDGGIIEKHQYGKVLGKQSNTKAKDINIIQGAKNDANLSQSWGLGSKDSKEWTDLDTAELIALVGDAASLGISFVPGLHWGAAGVGAAASTTNFITDIKRDGFQGRDLLNYGVNLGFDAMSAFTGAGGKVAKFAKNFPKTAKFLQKAIKLGAIAGVSDAVYNTIDAVAKGESFTLSDVRRIMNGVAGGITLSKTGLFSPGRKTVKTDPSIIKGKKAETPEIKLDTKKIETASKQDQLLELQSQVTAGYRAKNKNTKLTDDQILELYDIPTKKSTDFKWKVWKSSREVVPDLKAGKSKVDYTNAELDAKAKDRNTFQNWFFGTGKTQRAYNNMFSGVDPRMRQEIVMPENTTPGLISLNVPAVVRQIPGLKNTYLNLPNIPSTTQIPEPWHFPEEVDATYNQQPRMVFKKGGILKGNEGIPGIYSQLLKDVNVDLTQLDKPTMVDLNNPGANTLVTDAIGKAERKKLNPEALSIKSPTSVTTNYHKDHGGKHAQTWAEERKLADPSGGRPTGHGGNFDWNYYNKELLGLANVGAAISDAYTFRDQANKKADIYLTGQPSVWSGRGRARFQTLSDNQADQEIAANNTVAGTIKTSDSMLNMAAKLNLAQVNAAIRNQKHRALSQDYLAQLNQHAATQREDDKLAFETGNQARQYAMNSGLIRNAANTELTTNLGAIRDKYFNKLQSDINRAGLVDVQKQNKLDQLSLMRNQPGLTADQIANIDAQIANINSPEYGNILRRQARYGTSYAKKGTKLRSTTEQMLLDNNKLVARAIEKLNDNTMKLILKALS